MKYVNEWRHISVCPWEAHSWVGKHRQARRNFWWYVVSATWAVHRAPSLKVRMGCLEDVIVTWLKVNWWERAYTSLCLYFFGKNQTQTSHSPVGPGRKRHTSKIHHRGRPIIMQIVRIFYTKQPSSFFFNGKDKGTRVKNIYIYKVVVYTYMFPLLSPANKEVYLLITCVCCIWEVWLLVWALQQMCEQLWVRNRESAVWLPTGRDLPNTLRHHWLRKHLLEIWPPTRKPQGRCFQLPWWTQAACPCALSVWGSLEETGQELTFNDGCGSP